MPVSLSHRQAGSILRGSLLAALAGTATVCAGLVYLKPGQGVQGHTDSAPDDTDRDQPMETGEGEAGENASSETYTSEEGELETSQGGEGEERLSRVRRCRDGVQRWLATVTPSTRTMVRDEPRAFCFTHEHSYSTFQLLWHHPSKPFVFGAPSYPCFVQDPPAGDDLPFARGAEVAAAETCRAASDYAQEHVRINVALENKQYSMLTLAVQ